jgi:hypothetical protein
MIIALIVFTLTFLSATTLIKTVAATEKPQVHRVVSTTVEATVKAVDYEKRKVVLVGEDSKEVTIEVGDEVKNLAQVKVGDILSVEYIASVSIEVMSPEETEPGTATVTSMTRAQPGEKPGGVASQAVVVVMTIEDIDKENQRVTLKNADGKLATVKPRNPDNLNKVKVGDKIVITQTQSIAIKMTEKTTKK